MERQDSTKSFEEINVVWWLGKDALWYPGVFVKIGETKALLGCVLIGELVVTSLTELLHDTVLRGKIAKEGNEIQQVIIKLTDAVTSKKSTTVPDEGAKSSEGIRSWLKNITKSAASYEDSKIINEFVSKLEVKDLEALKRSRIGANLNKLMRYYKKQQDRRRMRKKIMVDIEKIKDFCLNIDFEINLISYEQLNLSMFSLYPTPDYAFRAQERIKDILIKVLYSINIES